MKYNNFFKNKESFFQKALTTPKPLNERSLIRGVSNARNTLMTKNSLKTMRKLIPSAITKGKGLVGKLALGATAMLNLAVLKGANKKTANLFERYMFDTSSSRNVLNMSRLGIMNQKGKIHTASTTGLSLALSRSRHGRY